MNDVFVCSDPERIIARTTTGNVQAFRSADDISVSVSFDLVPRGGGNGHAQFIQFMSAADARSLADALLRAEAHVAARAAAKEQQP